MPLSRTHLASPIPIIRPSDETNSKVAFVA
ncbi:hypothetical protein CCACVL1_11420 [Corchorus capsularis]|uniref:Uncharacterized protein n=1 Tax=Corchorus capsularis TaxID=210143 RepID=A0A1R3IL75_COCAP|nr:hypothetical protein CCACVL1_11420 [Corchorus capsularis]